MPAGGDPDFKQLRKVWYQRLKDEGFNDIENTENPHSPLHSWHSLKWKKTSPSRALALETYYQAARSLLHTYSFENEVHKRIWELHSEGFSKRKIEKQIIGMTPSYKREAIGYIIQLIAVEIK